MIEMESAFDLLAEDSSGYRLKEIREELFEMKTAVKQMCIRDRRCSPPKGALSPSAIC